VLEERSASELLKAVRYFVYIDNSLRKKYDVKALCVIGTFNCVRGKVERLVQNSCT
jgi:hypothetical protein